MSSPGMATKNPSDGQVKTLENAVFSERFEGVLRTGRSETACSRGEGRDADLIETDQQHERKDQNLSDDFDGLILLWFHRSLLC